MKSTSNKSSKTMNPSYKAKSPNKTTLEWSNHEITRKPYNNEGEASLRPKEYKSRR